MKAKQPIESPARFIEHVWNSIWLRLAKFIHMISELVLITQFVSEQHLGRSITRGQQIFKLVSRIVPAAARIDVTPGRQRSVDRAAIKRMANSVDPWVVATALLPHEFEELIRQFLVHSRVDREYWRFHFAALQVVVALFLYRREIQHCVFFEVAPPAVDRF